MFLLSLFILECLFSLTPFKMIPCPLRCRMMQSRSGPSPTALKNTVETAFWSDARP